MSLEIIEKIKSHQKFEEIDAFFVTKPQSVLYVLGFKIESDTPLFIPNQSSKKLNQEIKVFLSALEYDQVKKNIEMEQKFAENFELIKIPQGDENYVEKKIKSLPINKLGFEEDFVNVKQFNKWKEEFNDITLIGVSEILTESRNLKIKQEIERMRKAAEFGIKGFKAIYENIEEGKTEKELAAIAEFEMRKAGADGTSFDTIVASGARSAFPHAKTSDKKIEKGDIIIVDIGAKNNGYCSDMTRTFLFDPDSTNHRIEEKKQLINLVNEGQKFGLDNIQISKKGSEMDKVVREFFKKEHDNWGDRFIHSLGHGVGIDIHEDPYLSPISENELKEGMCVTVEPGLYIPELGGARTEDLIVVQKDGFEILTDMEKYYY